MGASRDIGRAFMKVLNVSSEVFPLIKTGGLADVAGALPAALAVQGLDVVTLTPGYPAVLAALRTAETILSAPDFFGGTARLLRGTAVDLDIIAIDAPHLFGRTGNPYLGPDGADWPDNGIRFGALGYAAAMLARGVAPGLTPDILHLHDWQAGLAAAYLQPQGDARPGIVATVHNLAFQGIFPHVLLTALRLDPALFAPAGLEYYGAISFLKAALVYADRITTVSPTYADEIRTPENGMGLDGVLRARGDDVQGILNGIDTGVWDPASDRLVAARYTDKDLAHRGANKTALQQRFGLRVDPAALLCGVVSRLSWQKGLDLLLEALPSLRSHNMQLALLGSGEPGLEAGFRTAAERDGDHVGCAFAYDEGLAHLVQAGSDALLVPSRFEPCGLTQLCALRYGSVPVVTRCGGLADTVIDANAASLAQGVATGVQFAPVTRAALEHALRRLADLWRNKPAWQRMQCNGMAMDVSWRGPAAAYAALFRALRPGVA
jgi:starch synthase